jgi:hypothetical protein
MYWIRIDFDEDIDPTTELDWIGNLFCNDADLIQEYPTFGKTSVKTAHTQGKTDWQEQILIASRLLIDDLINKNVIDSGDQILLRDDYRLACVCKTAEVIFTAFGDDYIDDRKNARKEYDERLSKRINRVDVNKNGIEDNHERKNSTGWISR